MPKLASSPRQWIQLSENPRLLSSSAGAGWQDFELQEIELSKGGTYEPITPQTECIAIMQASEPIKTRSGRSRKPFQDLLPYPHLMLPGDADTGSWQGAHRTLHLVIDTATIERFLHQPFRRNAFAKLEGPNPGIEHLLRALHLDTRHGHRSGTLLGELMLAALLCQLVTGDAVAPYASKRVELARGELDRARGWIDANLNRPFSLEDLASVMGVSVRHLHRTFAAATGLSPYRYILMRRIEWAKRLMQDEPFSLSEIATDVGFYDQAHMARTFRKFVGASPSQFRNTRK